MAEDSLLVKRPVPWVAATLIAINVAVFVWGGLRGAGWFSPEPDALVAIGGNLPTLTLNGEPWRLVTAMFLHAGLLHLAMNMVCLWSGGLLAEKLYGRGSVLVVYLAAGLAGGIASASRTTMIVSVGASGAIFGVFGAILAYLVAHRAHLDPVARDQQLKRLGWFMGINLVVGFTTPGIDMSAHIGGLVTGFLLGLGIEWRLELADPARAIARRRVRTAIAGVLAIGAVGVALLVLPKPSVRYVTKSQIASAQAFQSHFDTFFSGEKELLATFQSLNERAQRGELTDADFAHAITTELLPAWRTAAAQLGAVSSVPPSVAASHAAVLAYAQARIAHLDAAVTFLETDPGDAAARARADATLTARAADLSSTLEQFKATLKRP